MGMTSLILPSAIMPIVRVSSKRALLQEMCDTASAVSGLGSRALFDAVLQRERLGSTGVGNGVAIPHGKLDQCERIFGVFARLEKPIEFEAVDSAPVDLAFLLIAAEDAGADHLKALARVARLLRNPDVAAALRATRDAEALYSVLTESRMQSSAAA